MPRQEARVRVHLMDRVRVDVHQRTERVHGVDLRERIEEPILLVRGQRAVILANAQLGLIVVVAGDRRLVVLFARLETRVLEGMRHVARWLLRRVVPVDAGIGIAGVVRRLVSMVGRVLVVRVVIRRVVRPVGVGLVILRAFAVRPVVGRVLGLGFRHRTPPLRGRSRIGITNVVWVGPNVVSKRRLMTSHAPGWGTAAPSHRPGLPGVMAGVWGRRARSTWRRKPCSSQTGSPPTRRAAVRSACGTRSRCASCGAASRHRTSRAGSESWTRAVMARYQRVLIAPVEDLV